MTTQEKLSDFWETVKVKWFMLDVQQKQALILIAVYLWNAVIEIAKSYIQARVTNESRISE